MHKDRKKNYEYLIEIFGEEKLKNRSIFLIESAQHLLKTTLSDIKEYIGVDERVIENIVIDYFTDIARLKDFHEIEKSNHIKIASYTTYWILKKHPLHFKKTLDDKHFIEIPMLENLNEWFAFIIFINMAFDTSKYHKLLDHKRLSAWNNFTKYLEYFFSYRIVTPQALEMILIGLSIESPYFEA